MKATELDFIAPFDLKKFKTLVRQADRTDLSGLSSLFEVLGVDRDRHKQQTMIVVCDPAQALMIAERATVTIDRIVPNKHGELRAICIVTASKTFWKSIGYDIIGHNIESS